MAKLSPFEIASALNQKTGRLDVEESGYDGYMLNRVMSNTKDSALFANEMNVAWNLPKQMQFDFFYYGLPQKKRFGKWFKNQDDSETIDLIQEYLGCSVMKAKEVIDILTPHLDEIRQELDRGGTRNEKPK